MIKAVIFDFYGVIGGDEYHDWLDTHGFKREGKFKHLSKDMDKGEATIDEFFETLSKLSGVSAKQIEKEFLDLGSLNKELLTLILELKKKYKVALLSNAGSAYLRKILDSAGIGSLFDEVVISSEVGYTKPSSEIFEHTLNRLGVKASEAVFIDDNKIFCDAAESLGIKGIYFKGFNSLTSNLKEMGIIDN